MSPTKITCPYCWQSIEIEEIARTSDFVELVTDCEVCCRPIRVTATWIDDDDEPSLEAEPES